MLGNLRCTRVTPIEPGNGRLVDLLIRSDPLAGTQHLATLLSIPMSQRSARDLNLLMIGVFSPVDCEHAAAGT